MTNTAKAVIFHVFIILTIIAEVRIQKSLGFIDFNKKNLKMFHRSEVKVISFGSKSDKVLVN